MSSWFACYFLISGYVQGMSDLLSPILFVMDDEVEAFWCFVGFMSRVVSDRTIRNWNVERIEGSVSTGLSPDNWTTRWATTTTTITTATTAKTTTTTTTKAKTTTITTTATITTTKRLAQPFPSFFLFSYISSFLFILFIPFVLSPKPFVYMCVHLFVFLFLFFCLHIDTRVFSYYDELYLFPICPSLEKSFCLQMEVVLQSIFIYPLIVLLQLTNIAG